LGSQHSSFPGTQRISNAIGHWQQIEAGRAITMRTLLKACRVFKIAASSLLNKSRRICSRVKEDSAETRSELRTTSPLNMFTGWVRSRRSDSLWRTAHIAVQNFQQPKSSVAERDFSAPSCPSSPLFTRRMPT
jgi:hypothetical protein